MMPVKVKCKQCGRDAKSDEFVLDPVYKRMVCAQCVKDRRVNEMAVKKQQAQAERSAQAAVEEKKKPAGWDETDMEVERAYKQKQAASAKIERIDEARVKYTCTKCKYQFIVDTLSGRPSRCGYCSTPVKL